MYERLVRFFFKIYVHKKLSFDEYQSRMMKDRPFSLVMKYKKSISRFYNKVETSFDK